MADVRLVAIAPFARFSCVNVRLNVDGYVSVVHLKGISMTISDRDLRHLQSSIKDSNKEIASNVSNGCKAIDKGLSKYLSKIHQGITDSNTVQAVDLLTAEEISELRKLVSLSREEASAYTEARLKDPSYQGMYSQLSSLGFIVCVRAFDGSMHFIDVNPEANWAISRYDKKLEQEKMKEKEAKRQRLFDRTFSLLTLVIGWILGIFTPVLTTFVSTVLL